MSDKLYTQSDMDRELSALRERCAKVAETRMNDCLKEGDQMTRHDLKNRAENWYRLAKEAEAFATTIRALPITPHTEEGTR